MLPLTAPGAAALLPHASAPRPTDAGPDPPTPALPAATSAAAAQEPLAVLRSALEGGHASIAPAAYDAAHGAAAGGGGDPGHDRGAAAGSGVQGAAGQAQGRVVQSPPQELRRRLGALVQQASALASAGDGARLQALLPDLLQDVPTR